MSGIVGLKDNGIVNIRSLHSFSDTLQRIEMILIDGTERINGRGAQEECRRTAWRSAARAGGSHR